MSTSKISQLRDEQETLRLQLSACSTAAVGNTDESRANRLPSGHRYWSAAYGDVCAAVDREMDLRAEVVYLRDCVARQAQRISELVAVAGVMLLLVLVFVAGCTNPEAPTPLCNGWSVNGNCGQWPVAPQP